MTETEPRSPIDTGLWAGQWALAAAFFTLGLLKAFVPAPELQQGLRLVVRAPEVIVQRVGLVELLGALGVILPAATRILPRLTPAAAACLSGVALLGAAFPETAGGFGLAPPNLTLAALGAWVAWGRAVRAPIAPLGLLAAAGEDRDRAEGSPARDRRPEPRPSRGERGGTSAA
jgi:hypothetical protein